MKAQENTLYALITNGIVTEFFTSEKYKEWNENIITAIPLTKEQEGYVALGMQVNSDNTIPPPSLNTERTLKLSNFNLFLTQEIQALQGEFITNTEVATFDLQLMQAKTYLATQNADDVPFLAQLANSRGEDIATLANKIIEKHTTYSTTLAQVLGHYQNLIKQVEQAQSLEELNQIVYESVLTKDSK